MTAVTTYVGEQEAILGRLEDNWSNLTEIAYPNTEFDPHGLEHIEPVVRVQEAFNVDINGNAPKRVRHPGLLTINVKTPINQGNGRALTLGDAAASIFRNVSFDGIAFKVPTVRDLGAEGAWYRVQVDCPYWRDSIL